MTKNPTISPGPRRRRLSFAGLAALLATAVATSASAETVLRTMISTDIRGVMPGISPDVATGAILQNVYEGLVAWRSDGSVAPMLADKIETSPDGLSYTFTLRKGILFHNGQPLTSREVVWTWSKFLDPAQNWQCRGNFDGSRQIKIEAIEAPDADHVVFRLARPSGVFLSMMARSDCDSTGIAHPGSVDGEGRWVAAIGTGPFRLADWRRGEYVELRRFNDYQPRPEPSDGLAGEKRADVDRVRATIIPDTSTAQLAIRSGALDIWNDVDPTSTAELRDQPGLKLVTSPAAGINMVLIQARDPALSDARVRTAIAMSIDAEALREGIAVGYGSPSTSLVPATSANYGLVERDRVKYDPAEAKRLLKEVGYSGQEIVITTNGQFPIMKETGIIVQSMLQSAGLNARVEIMEFAATMDRYFKGRFQLQIFNATPYLDPVFSYDRIIGGSGATPEKVWRSDEANALLGKLFELSSISARQPVFDQLHRLFLKDVPAVTWANRSNVAAVRNSVRGFSPWAGAKPRFWNVSVAP